MTQLILDVGGGNVTLPESRHGKYTAAKEPLSTSVKMISGRIVREVRGSTWVVTYSCEYLDQSRLQAVLAACDKGTATPISCSFLPQESTGALTTMDFWVDSYTRPKFMWSSSGTPLWADFSITLRGARPVAK